MSPITRAVFSDRFVALVLGARDLPKKPLDFHVLLISSIVGLQPGKEYLESELNDELQRWVLEFGFNFGLDHVTLRQYLVDAKYISRDPAGKAYRLQTAHHSYSYDPEVLSVGLQALIRTAKNDREKRKHLYIGSDP